LPIGGPDPVLPSAFGKCAVLPAGPAGNGAVITSDPTTGLISASFRLSAFSPFLLAEPADQERLLGAFGDALGPLSQDRRVVSLRWSSFAAPAGAPLSGGLIGPAAASYRELAGLVGTVSHHEVFVTLTMAASRGPGLEAVASLVREMDLLAERLTDAGLGTVPMGPDLLSTALRRRLDPEGRGAPEAMADLAAATGLASLAGAGPMCVLEHWDHVQVDSTVHRAYHVIDWPRAGVPAAWMGDLLLALPAGRTLCVVLEPVSPRASRRAVERQAAKLDSDEEQRRRHGFRISAEHDATRDALTAREHEMVAGHSEFDYAGLVVLSAASVADLDTKEAQARSAASAAGVELAALHGRHAAAFATCLPLPRTITRSAR
jgi:hypothetical protein